MSISLPKLELPQISIKASVRQKKPFTLQLPVIKFNAHATTEEDEDQGYGSGGGYGVGGGGGYMPSAGGDTSSYGGGGGSASGGYGENSNYPPGGLGDMGAGGAAAYGHNPTHPPQQMYNRPAPPPAMMSSYGGGGNPGYGGSENVANVYKAPPSTVGYERPAAGQYAGLLSEDEFSRNQGQGQYSSNLQKVQPTSGHNNNNNLYEKVPLFEAQALNNQPNQWGQQHSAAAAASGISYRPAASQQSAVNHQNSNNLPPVPPRAPATGYYVPRQGNIVTIGHSSSFHPTNHHFNTQNAFLQALPTDISTHSVLIPIKRRSGGGTVSDFWNLSGIRLNDQTYSSSTQQQQVVPTIYEYY